MFPRDVVDRAKQLLSLVGTSTGAYTHSQGIPGIRRIVADFIQQRDKSPVPVDEHDIFLTNGASAGIELCLQTLIGDGGKDAIMLPIPQYPIYSALITRLGGQQAEYYLNEELGWAVTLEELERSLAVSQQQNGHTVKGLALINPGNPTGQVMDRDTLAMICQFCARHGIVLLADEVYQRNVYTTTNSDDKTQTLPQPKFYSAKQVASETPGCQDLQLVSFHSTSKGLIGECGHRGGYMELHNIDPYVHSQLYKLASTGLCSGVDGQLLVSLMLQARVPRLTRTNPFTPRNNRY